MARRLLLLLVLPLLLAADAPPMRILMLGDSLTEGLGVAKENAYPAMLQRLLADKGRSAVVINAGISGATSASAIPQLRWQLRAHPRVIVIALGANDALRGLKVTQTRQNLATAIRVAQENEARVLLVGMKAPPNYGPDYTRRFEAIYPSLAKEFKTGFVPFLLEGVAGERPMNQEDGIHPNEQGHAAIARHLLPAVESLL